MGTFALQLQEFAAKAKDRSDEVVGSIVMRVAAKLDERSPVGDRERWLVNIDRKARGLPLYPPGYVGGRFKGNWQLGVDNIPSGVLDRVDPDGRETLAAIQAAIPEDAAGKVYYLANNLPYARRLEDGHSTQAPPAGIVGLTVVEFETFVREQVAALP